MAITTAKLECLQNICDLVDHTECDIVRSDQMEECHKQH